MTTHAPMSKTLLTLGLAMLLSGQNALAADYQPQVVDASARIVGGNEATPGEYPWVAALVSRGMDSYYGQFCGGTLIDPEWVVTAAHCTEGETADSLDVVLGRHDLFDSDGERIEVNLIVEHPNYNSVTMDSDISLLRLSSPATQAPIAGLTLPRDPGRLAAPFTDATVVGWGDTSGNGSYPTSLMEVEVPILPDAIGRASYGTSYTINMMVAGYREGGKDSCYGDSGGPLVVPTPNGTNWVLAGVVSWGYGCAQPKQPGVYTRIERFSRWVKLEMQANTN